MREEQLRTYQDMFTEKYKKCKSKKDYKKLCREMIKQYEIIDQVDENQWQIFSSVIGSETYLKCVALAIKMCILQRQGVPCSIVDVSDNLNLFEPFE